MSQYPYSVDFDGTRCYLNYGSYSWENIINFVLSLEKHLDLQMDQRRLPPIPTYFEERAADGDGQDVDYGVALDDGKGIHLKVYGVDFYRIHWDAKDPNKDPFGHLLYDAPKYLVAGLIALGAIGLGYSAYKKSQKQR